MFLCPFANIVLFSKMLTRQVSKSKAKDFYAVLKDTSRPRPRTNIHAHFATSVTSVVPVTKCYILHTVLCHGYFFTQVECLRFLPTANKLTASKLDAIAAVQAATIFFSPDIVTFSILLKEVGFMGRGTSRDKSPVCLLRLGRARVVEFDMDQTCGRPGRNICLVGSGLVVSGPVWSVTVSV